MKINDKKLQPKVDQLVEAIRQGEILLPKQRNAFKNLNTSLKEGTEEDKKLAREEFQHSLQGLSLEKLYVMEKHMSRDRLKELEHIVKDAVFQAEELELREFQEIKELKNANSLFKKQFIEKVGVKDDKKDHERLKYMEYIIELPKEELEKKINDAKQYGFKEVGYILEQLKEGKMQYIDVWREKMDEKSKQLKDSDKSRDGKAKQESQAKEFAQKADLKDKDGLKPKSRFKAMLPSSWVDKDKKNKRERGTGSARGK